MTYLPLCPNSFYTFPSLVILVLIDIWPVSKSNGGAFNDGNLAAVAGIPVWCLIIPNTVKASNVGDECNMRRVKDVSVLEHQTFPMSDADSVYRNIVTVDGTGVSCITTSPLGSGQVSVTVSART